MPRNGVQEVVARADMVPEPVLADEQIQYEVARCMADPAYFINSYCYLQDAPTTATDAEALAKAKGGVWNRFHLWPAQYLPLRTLHANQLVCWLKARQLGLTWLALGYALWTRTFIDGSTVLLFSRRDTEATDMLSRLLGMAMRLPRFLTARGTYDARGRIARMNSHSWTGPDGGRVMAFPCSAGDSYTATLAIVDEADLVPNLDQMMSAVKPTIDAGGKLLLVSRVDKSKPESPFKRIYRGGRAGASDYKVCFLPWYARQSRTSEWYESQRRESLARTLSLDYLHEQYPATDDEALAARQLDKRFPADGMTQGTFRVFEPADDLTKAGPLRPWPEASWEAEEEIAGPDIVLPPGYSLRTVPGPVERVTVTKTLPCPRIPGLRLYRLPQVGVSYTIGVDPAQGNPGSNDSALVVVADDTGEEVASLAGKHAPKVLARFSAELCDWYAAPPKSRCAVMVERNNHGHAFLLWWESNRVEEEYKARLLMGPDGRVGWNQTGIDKETMYHRCSQRIVDAKCRVHNRDVYDQILDIEASTLEAPVGKPDDLAVAWGLALAGADLRPIKQEWRVVAITAGGKK